MVAKTFNIKGQKNYDDVFPFSVRSCAGLDNLNSLIDWIENHRDHILEKTDNHGAFLIRGFSIDNEHDFERVIKTFRLENLSYDNTLSNAIRQNKTERVFTANEAPKEVQIHLHHELAQTPLPPTHLFFYCKNKPSTGGETPICRSDILFKMIKNQIPEFIRDCSKLHVKYTNIMPNKSDKYSGQGRSWCSTLAVNNKQSAENKLRNLGYKWEWQSDYSIKVQTRPLPAIKTTKNGRKVFFNQMIAAFQGWNDKRNNSKKTICFGDGSEISSNHMSTVSNLADKITFNLSWEEKDILIIDNTLVMHGRRPYKGEREILASLAITKI